MPVHIPAYFILEVIQRVSKKFGIGVI